MSEVQLNGQSYRTGRLTAMQQFHVMRRLAPLFAGLDSDKLGAEEIAAGTGNAMASLLSTAMPVLEAIGAMPDDQAEYIIHTCLSVCERQSSGAWSRVQIPTPAGPQLMFADIDLPVMLQLCFAVIQGNFETFFVERPEGAGIVPFRASS